MPPRQMGHKKDATARRLSVSAEPLQNEQTPGLVSLAFQFEVLIVDDAI